MGGPPPLVVVVVVVVGLAEKAFNCVRAMANKSLVFVTGGRDDEEEDDVDVGGG